MACGHGGAKLGHEPVEMTAWRVSGLTKGIGPSRIGDICTEALKRGHLLE